ncbi:GRAM domain-containing protein 2B-like isoform X2 [Silurus meridionalis]|uniref:GRAM domain-containing protein n=1 Tax=Silurus meridionalis TaxID=175797 RepID=A0A8T0AME0_SILME|nr:GRAM domain-containing protein 2B-like isoform X2 [Silurus meridionalis]KAF7692540.1 hypothetical protein HF521_010150 [Silurus meridionalis]
MDSNKEMCRKYSLDSLGYIADCGETLGKSKECKMRRSSESMKGRVLEEAHFEVSNKTLQRSVSLRTTSTIEEEGAEHTNGHLNRSSLKNHRKTFHKHFPEISEMEEYINAFSCALQKEVLYHGKMYVSQHHVCFYSSVLLKETKVQIHTSTIQIIKKKNTARVVPNAISIITSTGEKYLFGSLRNRDACLNVLKSICPKLQHVSANSSPQMSSAENGHEVDTISSYSSQEEHSSDPHRFSVSGPDRTEGNALLSSPIKISNGEEKNNSTSWNGTRRDDHPLEENTAVSWVTMVTEKIRFLLSMGGTTNVNKLIIVYLILALLLLLSSGYIGLRIAALEEQLTTLGATSEFSLQKTNKET